MNSFFRTYAVVCFGLAAQSLLNIVILALFPQLNELGQIVSVIWFIFSVVWIMMAKYPFFRGMFYNSIIMAFMVLLTGLQLTLDGQAWSLGFYLVLALFSLMLVVIFSPAEPDPEELPAYTYTSYKNSAECPYCERTMRKVMTEDGEYEYHCPGCGSTQPN